MAEEKKEEMSVEEIEKILLPVDHHLKPFEPKLIELRDGLKLVIRQAKREEMPILMKYIEPLIHLEKDYYDIVSVRVYSELLGHYRYRTQDQYVLVGQIDGKLAGIFNGRQVNPKLGLSYHTLAVDRGYGVGRRGFATKMEYHFDVLGHDEVLIVAESPIGFRRWMQEYGLAKKFEVAHELGGGPSWTLTRAIFEKVRAKLALGTRPVPKDLLAKAMAKILPPDELPS